MASELSHQTVLAVLPNAGGGAVTVPLSSTATQCFVPELEQDCLGTNQRDSVRCSHEHQGRRSSALARFNHPFERRGAEFNQDGLRIVAPDSAWCASKRRRRCCNSAAQFNRNSIFRTSIGAGLPRNQPACVTVFGVLTSTRGGAPVHWLGSTTLFGVAEQSSIKMASALSHQTVLDVLPNAGGGAVTVPLSSTATQFFVPALEQDCLGTNRLDSCLI